MVRIDLYITERQRDVIRELSIEKGITFSEVLRILLDTHPIIDEEYQKVKNKKEKKGSAQGTRTL